MPGRTPAWITILIIIVALPLFSTPALLGMLPAADSPARVFVWIYPFYMVVAAYLAWKAYPQRSYLTWLLLILMVLTTVAIWLMASSPELIQMQ